MNSTRLACLILSAALGAGAADFWKDKKPEQWSEQEIQRMLTDSPWARDARLEFDMERFGGGPPPMGGSRNPGEPGGISRGGSMGGRGGVPEGMPGRMPPGGGPMGGPSSGMMPSVTVRWESAAPVAAARRLRDRGGASTPSVEEWVKDYYVLSVTGMPPMRRRGEEDRETDSERMAQMKARMMESTSLKLKKVKLAPAQVEVIRTPENRIVFYLFPRSTAIDPSLKDVMFESSMGPARIRAKFNLKEMTYGDGPAL